MRRRSASITVVLFTALALACAAGPAAGAAQPKPSLANRINALILGGASNPVIPALRERLGGRLQIDRTSAPPGSVAAPGKLRKYHLLIVDGDNLRPGQMARHGAIGRFTSSRRWVLAFDVRRKHFSRALDRQTGFSARSGGAQRVRAFLFRRTIAGGSPRVQMIQASSLLPRRAKRFSKRVRARLARRQAARVAAVVHRVVLGNGGRATAVPRAPDLPPELQHLGWTFTQVDSASPPDGYYSYYRQDHHYGGVTRIPNPGSQTTHWTMTHNFDVYLNNSEGHPQGDYQTITYSLDGQFAPKSNDGNFFQMYNKFCVGLDCSKSMERAWWTGKIGASVEPDAKTNANLVWQANQPQTPNEETTYKSGDEFEVGFAGSKEGAEIDATYKVSNYTSFSIPDWGVENRTAGNNLNWEFSARNPCDTRNNHYNESGCFDLGFGKDATPVLPNALSLGQNQVHVSGRWRTPTLLGPNDGQLSFKVDTPVQIEDSNCSYWDVVGFACPAAYRKLDRSTVGPPATTYSFNVGDVIPIAMSSLKLAPNPANGSKAEQVTGTIQLQRPAVTDTRVVIYSDSENAVVGPPINGGPGSQRTITIPKGQSSTIFNVLTNDNTLSPGQHTTAAVSAFYAQPITVQLRIEAH